MTKYTVTKNGVIRKATRTYSQKEIDRQNEKAARKKATTFEFYRGEDYYRRRPHALPTIAAQTVDNDGEQDYQTTRYGELIKPIRTPYGRLKNSSRKAKLGHKRPKDLYFDEVSGLYYEIANSNSKVMQTGEPVGVWQHVFVPANGRFECRFYSWAVRRGFSAAVIEIEDGRPVKAFIEAGPFEGETIAAGDPSLAMLPIMCGMVKAA